MSTFRKKKKAFRFVNHSIIYTIINLVITKYLHRFYTAFCDNLKCELEAK